MKIHYLLILSALAPALAHVLPTFNRTGIEPAWMPEPEGRGTIGILISCVFTLSLCVWTAIHTNVIPGSTSRKLLRNKLLWMFFSLTAPEVVLWFAFHQWQHAKEIHRKWCKRFNVYPGSMEDHLGLEGAFFVVMRGFTLGPSDNFGTYDFTITPLGFVYLIEKLNTADIIQPDRKLIIDKGKSDTIGKLLVCAQAVWMVLQCAARKATGLPVTLLEVNVVMHVVCAVSMYVFWWYKPLDVNEPISLIRDPELGILLSIAYGDKPLALGISRDPSTSEIRYFFIHDTNVCTPFDPTSKDNKNYLLAANTIMSGKYSEYNLSSEPNQHGNIQVKHQISGYFTGRGTNGRVKGDVDVKISGVAEKLIIWILCLIYGGCHAVAWDNHFPSPVERWLWRISCIGTGALPCIILIFYYFGFESLRFSGCSTRSKLLRYLFRGICGITIFFCMVFRLFMLVEAVISMRSLPAGSYQTVRWEDYWPHF